MVRVAGRVLALPSPMHPSGFKVRKAVAIPRRLAQQVASTTTHVLLCENANPQARALTTVLDMERMR